jgi:hypothetical protein
LWLHRRSIIFSPRHDQNTWRLVGHRDYYGLQHEGNCGALLRWQLLISKFGHDYGISGFIVSKAIPKLG